MEIVTATVIVPILPTMPAILMGFGAMAVVVEKGGRNATAQKGEAEKAASCQAYQMFHVHFLFLH